MGLTAHLPDYQLLADGADITALIRGRLISIRYTDEAGMDSDVLEVVLSDEPAIALPSTGARLRLFLGYKGGLQSVGEFVVDDIELTGWPATMTIRARAAIFDGSGKGGGIGLQTQHSRMWKAGTTLGAIVKSVAAEHGLIPAITKELDNIALPHTEQRDESNINLLLRLAKRYDAVVKPAAGRLVLAAVGQAKTASGLTLPTVSLTSAEVSSYRARMTRKDKAGTVVAGWHETKHSRKNDITIGSGEPVKRLKSYYPTQDTAQRAANAEYSRLMRKGATVSITMPGRPDVQAEGRVQLAGFRAGVDGTWSITRAEHSLDASGYSTSLEAELPSSDIS